MSANRRYLKMLPYQSEFSHQCACWAKNHRGWAKMKKFNRKQLRSKIKRDAGYVGGDSDA